MYQILFHDTIIHASTLVEVLHLLRFNRSFQDVESGDITLHADGGTILVLRYNDQLTVRMTLDAAALNDRLFSDVRSAWFDLDGRQAAPHEVRECHWDMFLWAFEALRNDRLLLSSDQIEQEQVTAAGQGRRFDLQNLGAEAARRIFGYAYAGPCVPLSQSSNSRHSVHVAYALLANLPVPEAVLQDYRDHATAFRTDMHWAATLLAVPELRGAMQPGKLQRVVSLLRHEKREIAAADVGVLAAILSPLADDASAVDIDDALFAGGFVGALPVPESFQQPVDVGTPVSPFAARLREILADHIRDRTLERDLAERAAGRMSQRQWERSRDLALLTHGRSTFDYPNEVSAAVDARNVPYLLRMLDTPDDRNRSSKRAIREVLGVKIVGLKPAARRRAVFALCGFDEAAQQQWESGAAVLKAQADRQRELEEAKEAAARARYRRADNTIVSGVEHVDASIREGFAEIRSFPKGPAKIYYLSRPDTNVLRRLSARDGTLAYARAVLQHAT